MCGTGSPCGQQICWVCIQQLTREMASAQCHFAPRAPSPPQAPITTLVSCAGHSLLLHTGRLLCHKSPCTAARASCCRQHWSGAGRSGPPVPDLPPAEVFPAPPCLPVQALTTPPSSPWPTMATWACTTTLRSARWRRFTRSCPRCWTLGLCPSAWAARTSSEW